MDADEVKTLKDAIDCLDKHKSKWAVAVAVDVGEYDDTVEAVFDLVLSAAKRWYLHGHEV